MLRGFLKGGLLGSLIVTSGLLLLYFCSASHTRFDELVVLTLSGALCGTGAGGVIGAVRASGRARLALPSRAEPRASGPPLRLTVSAIYALALSTVGTLVVLNMLGRRDLTLWVGALVPFDVTPVHARAMVAGSIYLAAFALVAGLGLRRSTGASLGRAEQRLVAGAGFMAGLLALPSLAVILAG